MLTTEGKSHKCHETLLGVFTPTRILDSCDQHHFQGPLPTTDTTENNQPESVQLSIHNK